jgi:hypothetical protein
LYNGDSGETKQAHRYSLPLIAGKLKFPFAYPKHDAADFELLQ